MKKIHKLISSLIIIAMLFSYLGIISNAVEEGGEATGNTNTGTNTSEETPTENTNSSSSGSSTSSQGQSSSNTGSSSQSTTSTQNQRTRTTSSNSSAQSKSSNANLSNLGIRPHDFTGFSPNKTSYSVAVPQDTETVEVYAQVADNGATVTGTGSVNLDEGENTINVTVTAEDGTTKTYTINITREGIEEESTNEASSGEGLSKLVIQQIREMTPEFQTNVYEYTVKYIGENTSLPIEVEPTDESYIVEITGNEELKEGENIITILVSTSAGENVATYQITVNKSLVDEEALAREQAEKEQRQRMIIGIVVAVVLIIAIVVFIIIRRRRNRAFAEEYSGVPFYGMNNDEKNYDDDFEEQPKALKKRKRYVEDDYDEESQEFDDEMDITTKFEEDEDEKLRRQRVREKFLNGYNRNREDDDMQEEDNDEYVETPRRRSKGKRFK